MRPGTFFSFEGLDGSGKSFQLQKLSAYLSSRQMDHLLTFEPGAGPVGNSIRSVLIEHHADLDSTAELLLFAADRAQHVKKIILPALINGTIVLCDRYIDSSIAYQGSNDLDKMLIQEINIIATGGLTPTLTFLMDLEVEEANKRIIRRKGDEVMYDAKAVAIKNTIRDAYLQLAEENSDRIIVIDGNRDEDEIFQDILARVEPYLPPREL